MANKKILKKESQPKVTIIYRPTAEQVMRYILTGASIFLFLNFSRYGFDNLSETEIIEVLYYIGATVGMWLAWGLNKVK